MKKITMLFATLLLATACESSEPTAVVDEMSLDNAPAGEATVVAFYDQPDGGRSGAASLPDGRVVYAEGASLKVWSEAGTEALGPWEAWSPSTLETPLVIDGVVILHDASTVAGVSIEGELLWHAPLMGAPVDIDGRVGRCVNTGDACRYTLLDPHSGEEVWSHGDALQRGGYVPLVTNPNREGFCLNAYDGVRVFGPDGAQRLGVVLGSIDETEMGPAGVHSCTATPWGSIVSYSDFVAQTHLVVGFDLDGTELWSVDLPGQNEGELAEVVGYLDGALVRTDEGVRRLGPEGEQVWGPNEFLLVGIYDVSDNGDMLVRAYASGSSLHAVHADLTPFMHLSVGPSAASIDIRHAALDGDRVVTTAARTGILDRDRWAQIVFWE